MQIERTISHRWGRGGAPKLCGSQGVFAGRNKVLASGMVKSFGLPTAQYIPLTITDA